MRENLERFLHLISVAKTAPLPLVLTRGLRKLGFESSWTRQVDFLHSRDTQRATKAVDILLRTMERLSLPIRYLTARVPGATLMEVGCGRHIGLASFAITLGAKRYIGVDPDLDAEILQRKGVVREYLEPAAKAAYLLAKHLSDSHDLSVDTFSLIEPPTLLESCTLVRGGVEALNLEPSTVDLCVSISCLEHITDFPSAASMISSVCHPDTLHLHIVNFSNHLSKRHPFKGLYDGPYAKFAAKWKGHINGLRVSDVLRVFEGEGLLLSSFVLDARLDALPDQIHPEWADRYPRDELATRVALLTNLPQLVDRR